MHICAKSGNVDHMQALINIGGNVVMETHHTKQSKKSKDFITPIHISIENKHPQILRLLLKNNGSKLVTMKKVITKDKAEMLMNYATRIFTESHSLWKKSNEKAEKKQAEKKVEDALLVGKASLILPI